MTSMLFIACGEQVEFEAVVNKDCKLHVVRNDDEFTGYVYYYFITKHGEYVVPQTHITSAPNALLGDEVEFSLITCQQSAVVALVESNHPHIVLAVYDSESNESWPGSAAGSNEEPTYALGEKLLAFLPLSSNGKDYVLGYKARSENAK